MARTQRTMAAAALAIATATAAVSTAQTSTFHAWQITGVPYGDILNVRKWPASHSAMQAGYPNGTVLSMTGRCKGGLMLDQLAGLSHAQKRQAVRYRWCEIWHDPARNEQYVTGWVYMKYMQPMN